jgi:endonuclease YncB( thermonuclease family)
MRKRRGIVLLSILLLLFFTLNYKTFDGKVIQFLDESETGFVSRIVDGDTAIINNQSTRFLGINTPEKGEFYYQEAKDFLSSLILNKTIKLEFGKDKTDLYERTLAYIILNEDNINIEMVKNGFANVYILNKDEHTSELRNAWDSCVISNKNLCEKSVDKCANCIKLKDLNVKSQTAIFVNNCNFECELTGWTIKDEGRKRFIFPNFKLSAGNSVNVIVAENGTDNNLNLYWIRKDYVWTESGDTLFLRDKEGGLGVWRGY